MVVSGEEADTADPDLQLSSLVENSWNNKDWEGLVDAIKAQDVKLSTIVLDRAEREDEGARGKLRKLVESVSVKA